MIFASSSQTPKESPPPNLLMSSFSQRYSRKLREGAIISADYREVADQFTTEWNHLSAIHLSPALMVRARSVSCEAKWGRLIACHFLLYNPAVNFNPVQA
jgi:hypothetical protein